LATPPPTVPQPIKIETAAAGLVVLDLSHPGLDPAQLVPRLKEVMSPTATIVAFGPQCTHLGCAYHWNDSKDQFVCPCHNSFFSIEGKNKTT
jgi:Rieske Fe-S protein